MNRTQIYLPKTQIEALRKIARRKHSSVSDVVRVFIKERVEKRQYVSDFSPRESLLDAAKRINKLGKKGPKDLASNLDAYLYGGKQ
jgi:hypothetical protein